jgi:hypothetical protein
VAKNAKSNISERHSVTLSEAVGSASTITVYGRLIKEAVLDPVSSGILHPNTPGGEMVLGQVVGFVDQGSCQKVVPPVILTLPEPDGPADGCDWDPNQFVAWKNLPRNWITLHLHVESRVLAAVLSAPSAAKSPGMSFPSVLGVQDTVFQIVKTWAGLPGNPRGTDILQVLWAAKNPGPFPDAAQDLATRMNNAFGTHLSGSDINPPGSIKSVNDLISAVS